MNEQFWWTLIFLVWLPIAFLVSAGVCRYVLTTTKKKQLQETTSTEFDLPMQVRWRQTSKPFAGGIAFFSVFILAALFSGYFFIWPFFTTQLKPFLGLTVACFVGFAIGRADDTMHLSPKFKLFGQFLAIFVLVIHGVVITAFGNWWLNIMLTFFWGVGIMNAINLFDNMDGVATIASIGSILAMLGVLTNNHFPDAFTFWMLSLLIACLGSLLGYLYYNFYPAKVYMGDAGSQFLGVFLAGSAILILWPRFGVPNEAGFFWPQFVLPILAFLPPLIDTTTVTLWRLKQGKSPLQGGRDHTTHHLFYAGFSEKKIAIGLFLFGIIQAVFCYYLANIVGLNNPSHWAFVAGALYCTIVMAGVLYVFTKTKAKK